MCSDYWFTPGTANPPLLGYVGSDIRSGRKKLMWGNDEFTTWIESAHRTGDGNAIIFETANSIYLVPGARGALMARRIVV